MIWYHGTSKEKKAEILATWFDTYSGTWGNGAYFSSSRDAASLFGDSFLKVDIPESEVRNINFAEWQAENPIENKWPELMKNLNVNAVAIHYDSGEVELCVFNPDIIRQIFY
ncbi:hypothetical protein [Paenibacillus tyrfis]|uniref:hypothetical protein n=1 Tax=Paenibacillus tyrfis TaxID=1501230 RepID=UPI000B59069E|nr:hypothetical protein [Paenibacillus tyrfis]